MTPPTMTAKHSDVPRHGLACWWWKYGRTVVYVAVLTALYWLACSQNWTIPW